MGCERANKTIVPVEGSVEEAKSEQHTSRLQASHSDGMSKVNPTKNETATADFSLKPEIEENKDQTLDKLKRMELTETIERA